MAKFITGKDLEEAVYDIIYDAKHMLLIVSPFIKLDDYFRELFDKHIGNSELNIIIVFGKNENQIQRSFNIEDFAYFKKFPNISIVYVPNLHAKYYANEKRSIISSINLYDYSFKNNIEFGVLSEPSLLGNEKHDKEAWEKCMRLIDENNVIFVRQPQYKKKLLGKDYMGSVTSHDSINELVKNGNTINKKLSDFSDLEYINVIINPRVSREDFEKQENKKQVKSKTNTGVCIECGKKIKQNPKFPYCNKCYVPIKEKKQYDKVAKYCHLCGKDNKSTLNKPVCYDCYKTYKDKFEFV